MAKLIYTVRQTTAPCETEPSTIPVLVDRLQPTSLAAVIENAIDRNLIAGLKPSAAEGVADGIARQLAHEFSKGHSIAFGQYFYGRPYLSGTVDANGTLTAANKINVRLYKGEDFKLSLDDFSFSYEDGGNLPKVDFIVSEGKGKRGVLSEGDYVHIEGKMLHLDGDTNTVTFTEVGASSPTATVTSFRSAGPDILSFAFPAGLDATKKYDVVVSRTDENGVTTLTDPKTVTIEAAPVNPNAPVVTSAYPIDHQDDTEHVREAEAFVIDGRNFGGTSVKYQYKHGEDGWSGLSEPLDGDEEYHRNEEDTEIEIFRQTVNGIITDNELETGDLVKFVITNSDGSASVQRTVQLA